MIYVVQYKSPIKSEAGSEVSALKIGGCNGYVRDGGFFNFFHKDTDDNQNIVRHIKFSVNEDVVAWIEVHRGDDE